ncbi:hypothetical protein F5884DRAFT_809613 [Xylogone sp. PMI_703]|nr:hypothetical protein F5884DRAFT_809613 [Xylogone sp. PMI_703]
MTIVELNMETRHKRLNYRILNDGSDEEAYSEDRITIEDLPTLEPFLENTSLTFVTVDPSELSISSSIAPSESISQIQPSGLLDGDFLSQAPPQPRKKAHPEWSSWLWSMFRIIPRENETFVDSRTKKLRKEKDIYCQHLGCNWRILESRRGLTSNLALHLSSKHNITRENPTGQSSQQSSLLSFVKPSTVQATSPQNVQQLQENVCRWGVITMQPFVAVETLSFRKIFEDIPSVDLPFQSATTYKRYVEKEFVKHRRRRSFATIKLLARDVLY